MMNVWAVLGQFERYVAALCCNQHGVVNGMQLDVRRPWVRIAPEKLVETSRLSPVWYANG